MCVWRRGGISPFTVGWTLGMLTGCSANLVRVRSRAETGKAAKGGDRGGFPVVGERGWGVKV